MPKTTTAAHLAAATRLAEQTAEAMYSRDAASRLIGLKIIAVRPGYSHLTMVVRPDMVNGHHICHGGFLFTLADSAFAYACNAYNRNTVASACHIDFLAPAREGRSFSKPNARNVPGPGVPGSTTPPSATTTAR
jgi:acyl-CoA thioesterase